MNTPTGTAAALAPARRGIIWPVATLIVAVLLAVLLLLNKSWVDTRLCPPSALACWSSGNTGYLGLPVAFGAFFLGIAWLRFAKRLTVAFKLYTVAAAAAALLLTAWGTYRDGEQYEAIAADGVLVKDREAAPALHRWSDTAGVLAWCETGSRSGPRLELHFRMRNGGDVSYEYKNWVRLSRANPSLISATNPIPYRTRNISWCDRNYGYLPVAALNSAPPWFPSKPPGAALWILLTLAGVPSVIILVGLFVVARQQEAGLGPPPSGNGTGS